MEAVGSVHCPHQLAQKMHEVLNMVPTTNVPEVLTIEETAEFLRLPEEVVRFYAGRLMLPGRQIGDQWRFSRRALEDWLAVRRGSRRFEPGRRLSRTTWPTWKNCEHRSIGTAAGLKWSSRASALWLLSPGIERPKLRRHAS